MFNRGSRQSVFSNIFSNAIKYSPDGGHIEISAKILSEHETVGVLTKALFGADRGFAY
jgi:signal transduction histidine kinase